jgi:hypothetical protein
MAALADFTTLTEAKTRALQEAARTRNVELSIYQITRGDEIVVARDKAQASGAAALNVLASPMLDGNAKLIMEQVAALRLPTRAPANTIVHRAMGAFVSRHATTRRSDRLAQAPSSSILLRSRATYGQNNTNCVACWRSNTQTSAPIG